MFYALIFLVRRPSKPLDSELVEVPFVTVQLPIYNERYVVERLIDAAAALDWRKDRLQIQVLDDSDDECTITAAQRVEHHRRNGIQIELLRRPERTGFKAGALEFGLQHARGEYIAIFDADFVPESDYLKRTIPHMEREARIGMVQARWAHLNAEYSLLTRAQAIALDGHFAVEQRVRTKQGWFLNFNGTAGVWRRSCIEDAGGWRAETLAEDLDLSYRAQLKGWKLLFLEDVVCPAELPPQIHAWKRQQFRWAKGSTQCLVEYAGRVIRSPEPLLKRVQALFHLSGYLVHPALLLLLFSLVPLLWFQAGFPTALSYLSLASLGPPLLYGMAQRNLYRDWLARFAFFPALMLFGVGLSFNNSIAVAEGLLGRPSAFRRTPKFNVVGSDGVWTTTKYALPFGWEAAGEAFCALYALAGIAVAVETGHLAAVPFLALYFLGFGGIFSVSLWHSRGRLIAPGEELDASAPV